MWPVIVTISRGKELLWDARLALGLGNPRRSHGSLGGRETGIAGKSSSRYVHT
jgi:hypothetical protein